MRQPLDDKTYPYPRLCAHRGWSGALPENTLPAYGAAIALGADEIELDLYSTTDGVLVSCHSYRLSEISDGDGIVYEKSYAELEKLDFGVKFGEEFRGLRIATLEEILRQFGNRVIINIHMKIWDLQLPDDKMEETVALVKKYGCERSVYFLACNAWGDDKIREMKARHPEISCALGHDRQRMWESVERAIEVGADKMQQYEGYVDRETVEKAHKHGIRVGVYVYEGDRDAIIEKSMDYYRMGVDYVLTDHFLALKNRFDAEFK